MRKRFLAIALCLVMVSAFAVTSAVSATKEDKVTAGKSDIRHYDVYSAYTLELVGKLTVNFKNRHYSIDANWGRAPTLPDGSSYKDFIKGFAPHAGIIQAVNGAHSKDFGSITYNKGGTAHGDGTLDLETLGWLDTYGGGATFTTTRIFS